MSAIRVRRIIVAALVAAGSGSAQLAACGVGRTPSSSVALQRATGDFDETLPELGIQLPILPDGAGRSIADRACLSCHSGDMLQQQRLTEKQWTATVSKMIAWGAAVGEEEKAQVIAYLVQHFGPDNDRFRPVVTRPAGR